jgi:hypothetical protein
MMQLLLGAFGLGDVTEDNDGADDFMVFITGLSARTASRQQRGERTVGAGMRERLGQVGGQLEIESSDRGTTVRPSCRCHATRREAARGAGRGLRRRRLLLKRSFVPFTVRRSPAPFGRINLVSSRHRLRSSPKKKDVIEERSTGSYSRRR